MNLRRIAVLLAALVLVAGCSPWPYTLAEEKQPELPVLEIELDGAVARSTAELSGLAWYGDTLLLLPQYPARFKGGTSGALFMLSKAEILAYLDGEASGPLIPRALPFNATGVRDQFRNFEGYESIGFAGNRVYMTIEARVSMGMVGYIVSGTIAEDLSSITMDAATLHEIPTQTAIANRTDEALVVDGERIVTFYESNGRAANPAPTAHVFDMQLQPEASLTMPGLEYRITDATSLDAQGEFWVINSFFPVEAFAEEISPDLLAEEYGVGKSHAQSYVVERLVAMRLSADGVEVVERPPLYLQLDEDGSARNWEGLVRLDERGFLLVTDRFPGTKLAFVPFTP